MSKTSCPRCGNEGHRGRCKSSALAKQQAAEPATEAPAEIPVVQIEPSMGARVRIAAHVLEIEQDRKAEDGEYYTYTITLYPHEARQVIDAIAGFVEKAA